MTIEAVGFDFGGVIAHKKRINFDREMSLLLEVPQTELVRSYNQFSQKYNSGLISRSQLWIQVLDDLNRKQKLESAEKFIANLPKNKVRPAMLNLIKLLADNGFKTGILTNRSLENAMIMKKMVAGINFDAIVVSSEEGLSKPQVEFFNLFCNRLKVKPENLCFVDDVDINLHACAKIGIEPVKFINTNQLKRDLITILGISRK